MPQRTLRFKIHQDGRVEETVEGFNGSSCNEATKKIEEDLGDVKLKKKTSEAFLQQKTQEFNQQKNQSNVTF